MRTEDQKAKRAAYMREYNHRPGNMAKVIARTNAWGARNREKVAGYKRKYAENNPSKVLMAHRKSASKECCKIVQAACGKKYRLENPHLGAAKTAKYRAAKLQRTPPWLTDEHEQQTQWYYKQAQRLTVITGEQYSVDHIIPLQGEKISGLHVPWNLQVMTLTANKSKHNRINL